jgi:FtsP/CotA-like multicopper oxidase with cupredoxin domain
VFSFLIMASMLLPGISPASAMPAASVDETKVPHYFGPNPNWANSPFTLPDVQVEITGDGTGATAEATVGANGAIAGITVTNPGADYTSAGVLITGAGTGADASAFVTASGLVTSIVVDNPGDPLNGGYSLPVVTVGLGSETDATATAYGGVDVLTLGDPGFGYQMPTIEFDMPDDPNGVQAQAHAVCAEVDCIPVAPATTVTIVDLALDNAGSGYATAPKLVIRDGTLESPIPHDPGTFGAATATATLTILSVSLETFGSGYLVPPDVAIDESDPYGAGNGALAHSTIDIGGVTSVVVNIAGSGYITTGGIQKFTDGLPGLCDPLGVLADVCPHFLSFPDAKYIPLGVADGSGPYQTASDISDTYEIGLVQYRMSFSSSLPPTLVRGYVQLETAANIAVSQSFPLYNEMMDGTKDYIGCGAVADCPTQVYGVTPPQYLGPTLVAVRDKPVRIVFRNLLPNGEDGDLFLPLDGTIMGSGMGPMAMPDPAVDPSVMDEARNPMCSDKYYFMDPMMRANCFTDNRATLHLHGGNSPWISDGTAHQWITPAGEGASWPEGVSVENVPDMDVCNAEDDGCQTFYYTNQQSARLLFYHDHAWGITRLNVYAGEAAGYLITDAAEQALLAAGKPLASVGYGIPLVVQDKTFVPQDSQMYNQYDALGNVTSYGQDPTWDAARWGGYGSAWYHHVYMPAQNPGDPGGMSAYGRWMYGPWFWPPAGDAKYGPIPNPYFNKDPDGLNDIRGDADDWQNDLAVPCNLDDPLTWQYDTDPFCEPQLIPGTPNISVGMEQFNDTPLVNGTAYPTVTLEPKAYRFRMLNAANDRFFNFQWYVADPSTASAALNTLGEVIGGTEVALNEAEVAAAQTDPVVFPTPDTFGEAGDPSYSLSGPDWIQIGTEGGFLPAPVVVDGQQVTTWITDPTRFDVGNVDRHSLLLAPAERADVVVDFKNFAGKTLILYNDAPAAFPARVPSYDYYTGYPNMSPNGPAAILPGYGPNTRTIMQVKIAGPVTTPAAINLTALRAAFRHHVDGSGTFESGQHPIIVGQAGYNSAYGTGFAASSWCNAPGSTSTRCDGYARISDQGGDLFGFNTLKAPNAKMQIPIQPKAIHDEMNSTNFDEYGRMQATLGVEVVPATPGLQNVVLYPFVNPVTEIIDVSGLPVANVKVEPISSATDGTQIWKITHNGVDTHPIHFHAYDVQVLNRVTWDNIIIPPETTELGWKDTVRISPLEDTIVALRPVIPWLPFEVPNNLRPLNPMMPLGSTAMFNNTDVNGIPTALITNEFTNFGWEYVYHCHILSHEEMDMMRAVSLVAPPKKAIGVTTEVVPGAVRVNWTDDSINDTAFVVQRSEDGGTTWADLATITMSLDPGVPATSDQSERYKGARFFDDTSADPSLEYQFRVVAKNTVGYGGAFPTYTLEAVSDPAASPPAAPTNLQAALVAGPQVDLTWVDNAANETAYEVERSDDGGAFALLQTLAADAQSYSDLTVTDGHLYDYRVRAVNGATPSAYSNVASVSTLVVEAPTNLVANLVTGPQVDLTWVDNATNETGYELERSVDGGAFALFQTLGVDAQSYSDAAVLPGHSYDYQVRAVMGIIPSPYSNVAGVVVPTVPATPGNPTATVIGSLTTGPRIRVIFRDNAINETGFQVWRSVNGGAFALHATLPIRDGTGNVVYDDFAVSGSNSYAYFVYAMNGVIPSAASTTASASIPAVPAVPTNFNGVGVITGGGTTARVNMTWTDNANNENRYVVQRAPDASFTTGVVNVNLAAGTQSYAFTGLTRGTTYYIRIMAQSVYGGTWVALNPTPIITP